MRSQVVPMKLLDHLSRWDARHVLRVADEMASRGYDLDDADAARQCSNDIKFLANVEQKERKLPLPQIKSTSTKEI
jgi:hypothetical protein